MAPVVDTDDICFSSHPAL